MEKITVALDNIQEQVKEFIEEAKRLEKRPWVKRLTALIERSA